MAYFKRLSNDYIYIYHWIEGSDYFKISTKMKVKLDNWSSTKERPKNQNTIFKDRLVVNELVRYESALRTTLAQMPDLTKDNLPEFRKLFLSILSPTTTKKASEYRLLPYYKKYVDDLKAKKQTNYKYYQANQRFDCFSCITSGKSFA